jgi:DNA-binding HxlR family transcriptional regulator
LGYGVHTFAKIAAYTGASRDILASRLRKLEEAGVIERRQYSEHPPRFEYHLTQAGNDLLPVMIALRAWGDRYAVERPTLRIPQLRARAGSGDHLRALRPDGRPR